MNKKNDIFDMNKQDDLSDAVKRTIKPKSMITEKIMSLFEIKSDLSSSEVVVGLYRAFKLERSKSLVSSRLLQLVYAGKLKKKKLGRVTIFSYNSSNKKHNL